MRNAKYCVFWSSIRENHNIFRYQQVRIRFNLLVRVSDSPDRNVSFLTAPNTADDFEKRFINHRQDLTVQTVSYANLKCGLTRRFVSFRLRQSPRRDLFQAFLSPDRLFRSSRHTAGTAAGVFYYPPSPPPGFVPPENPVSLSGHLSWEKKSEPPAWAAFPRVWPCRPP